MLGTEESMAACLSGVGGGGLRSDRLAGVGLITSVRDGMNTVSVVVVDGRQSWILDQLRRLPFPFAYISLLPMMSSQL